MQFIDQADVEVAGGNGGDGMVSFRREKYVPTGGPSGGDGGKGGSVILVADANLQTLLDFRYAHRFVAAHGQRGGPKNRTGATGADRQVDVPCGTLIYDADTHELLGDLVTPGQRLCVAAGGKGGLGNKHFLSNRNRAPEHCLPGLEGEVRRIRLELKLLAEVGIVGLPNAGKSTLIASLSAARPKIADYPFTTLIPNLGVVRKPTGDGTVFADIPGLIEGAHTGAGLGHDFLRHVERTRLLLHLVDITAVDPVADYHTIQQELQAYSGTLANRPQILALNKIDAVPLDEQEIVAEELMARSGHDQIFLISAVSQQGLGSLMQQVWQTLEEASQAEVSQAEALSEVALSEVALNEDEVLGEEGILSETVRSE
ncbi:MAG: GTPase ObgE [Cyanobacteria bacterium P01_A01_bin.105]